MTRRRGHDDQHSQRGLAHTHGARVAPAPDASTCPTHRGQSPTEAVDAGSAIEEPLAVRCQIILVGGEAGRALASAQGSALAGLLTSVGGMEVGQGEEDRSP